MISASNIVAFFWVERWLCLPSSLRPTGCGCVDLRWISLWTTSVNQRQSLQTTWYACGAREPREKHEVVRRLAVAPEPRSSALTVLESGAELLGMNFSQRLTPSAGYKVLIVLSFLTVDLLWPQLMSAKFKTSFTAHKLNWNELTTFWTRVFQWECLHHTNCSRKLRILIIIMNVFV